MDSPRFETFGPDHLVWLVVCLLGCAGAVWLGRRLRSRGVEPSFRRVVAVPGGEAGAQAVRTASRDDPFLSARFRLEAA